MQVAKATGGYRREVSLLRVLGPRGPGRCYAAPPGLVMWVNRESFTKPTLWYGSPARSESALVAMTIVARTFLIQRFRSLFRPGGPALPMQVAKATGLTASTTLISSSLPCRAAMGERARVRGHCSPPAIGSGVFAIATMDSGRFPMNRRWVELSHRLQHAIDSHTLRDSCRVCVAIDSGKSSLGSDR